MKLFEQHPEDDPTPLWEPEPLRLPLEIPAYPEPTESDRTESNDNARRVIVIDLT